MAACDHTHRRRRRRRRSGLVQLLAHVVIRDNGECVRATELTDVDVVAVRRNNLLRITPLPIPSRRPRRTRCTGITSIEGKLAFWSKICVPVRRI